MIKADILTNEFLVQLNLDTDCLLIFTIHQGKQDPPIRLKLDILIEMGSSGASKWVGETTLLLIPEMREKLFHIDDDLTLD